MRAAPILILHAHPRPRQSRVTRALLDALAAQPGTAVRSLYELYPDFDIDVAAEQQAAAAASLLVWLAPVHWYGFPAMLKHWVDQVLAHGWAYGEGASALQGKAVWWVCSAGAPAAAYAADGAHMRPFEAFVPPIEQIARFCGMDWWPPFVVHGGHALAPAECAAQADRLVATLQQQRQRAAWPPTEGAAE